MSRAPTPLHLTNHEKVVVAFGYWPLFHDAEVRSLKLDRNQTLFEGVSNPQIELVIHALEWTEAKDDAPPSFNHHLVHLNFEEVDDVQLSGFNHQNALYSVRFEIAEVVTGGMARHRVGLDPAHGLGGSFTYARGHVVSIVPCSDQGAPR